MSTAMTDRQPVTGERTGAQVVTSFGLGLLGQSALPATYATYRLMRKHPTIALARALSIAPIVAAEWSVESSGNAPSDAAEFIDGQFLPIREPLLETALYGGCDFGHQPYEKVFAELDGRVGLRKLKPLLQDLTELQIEKKTGAFQGFRQKDGTVVPLEYCLLLSFRVEGTQWHGQPLLENARKAWNEWNDANSGAARYDRKIAGSHFMVGYPPGKSVDAVGDERDNSELAKEILNALESSGSVAIPRDMEAFVEQLNVNNPGWTIEILEDSGGRQPTFIDRLRYLDVQMVRSMILPERAVMEGEYGTKAEAGEHIDLAMTVADLTHRHVTRLINWHAVDQLLALNWGEAARGSVWLSPAPIVDEKRAYLKEIYRQVLSNPAGFLEEYGAMDLQSLKEALGVPVAEQQATPEIEVEGVDADSPEAAAARRLYAGLEPPPPPEPSKPQEKPMGEQDVKVSAEAVLNANQIKEAREIVLLVAKGQLPRDAGLGQLEVLFNLQPTQAERIMGSAGTVAFEKPEPVPNPFAPRQPDEDEPGGTDDEEPEEDSEDEEEE